MAQIPQCQLGSGGRVGGGRRSTHLTCHHRSLSCHKADVKSLVDSHFHFDALLKCGNKATSCHILPAPHPASLFNQVRPGRKRSADILATARSSSCLFSWENSAQQWGREGGEGNGGGGRCCCCCTWQSFAVFMCRVCLYVNKSTQNFMQCRARVRGEGEEWLGEREGNGKGEQAQSGGALGYGTHASRQRQSNKGTCKQLELVLPRCSSSPQLTI